MVLIRHILMLYKEDDFDWSVFFLCFIKRMVLIGQTLILYKDDGFDWSDFDAL